MIIAILWNEEKQERSNCAFMLCVFDIWAEEFLVSIVEGKINCQVFEAIMSSMPSVRNNHKDMIWWKIIFLYWVLLQIVISSINVGGQKFPFFR